MKKSLLLLASFAGLVACFEKKEEPTADQATTETCPVDAAAPVAAEPEKKVEEPAAPAAAETPAAEKPA